MLIFVRSYMLWMLLSITIVFSTGCGRNDHNFVVWSSMRPAEREVLDSLLSEFSTRYPQYAFNQLFYSPEEARTNFIISSLAGKGPELIHGANDNIGPFVELKVIQPLDTLFDSAFLNRFMEEPLQANSTFRGKLYQIADRVGNHLCLVYNKDIIAEPPRTISELIETGKRLTKDHDGDGNPDRYALAWNYTEPFFAIPFIGGYGGWIIDENNNPTLNTDATIKAARLIYDLANKHKIIPQECDYEIANALFKDELSAMIINGPWSWSTYLKNDINIGLARIPKIDETGLWPTPLVSPMGYSINVNLHGERLDIAVELVKFLTSKDAQFAYTKLGGSIPSMDEAYRDPLMRNRPLINSAIDQLMVGKPMPVVTEMRWIFDAMRPAYQGIFTGRVSPEAAAREMQQLAEKLIRENRE